MIKRVVKLKEDRFSGLEHKINDFIDITLADNEYIDKVINFMLKPRKPILF